MNFYDKDPLNLLLEERARLKKPMALFQRTMTGFPSAGEKLPLTGPVQLLTRDLLLLVGFALAAGFLGYTATIGGFHWLALPPSLLFSLAVAGRLRKLTVGHMHECGHGVGFSGWRARGLSRRAVRVLRFSIAEFCSIFALTTPARLYMRNHGRHHALSLLGTIFEPDGAHLAREGFVQGIAKGSFYRRLLLTLTNPGWYLLVNIERLWVGATFGSRWRRALSCGWVGALTAAALVLPPSSWLMAIGLPWLVLFPAASLMQVVTEHPYGARRAANDFASYAARTWDRIPWTRTPLATGCVWTDRKAWLAWGIWTALVHVPARIAVLDTTMIWHRYHHIAWLIGRPFDAWWNIGFEVAAAWRDGVLPACWQANTLDGLPAALKRQEAHLERPEDL